MSENLSRAQQSAWQRWELASLGTQEAVGANPEVAARANAEQDAARAHEHAKIEGRAQGYAEGMTRAAGDVAALQRLLSSFAEHAARHEQQLADEVLDLALLFARQLVGQAVNVRRELVLPIVASALSQLPQATRQIELRLDPADVALVRSVIPADHPGPPLSIIPDPKVGAGGCVVETDQASVDATVASRWRRLLATLGRTDDWLDAV